MFKFNSDNIFTGYIKQLLASFNLPKYKVYTLEQQKYHDKYLKDQASLEGLEAELQAIIDSGDPNQEVKVNELKAQIATIKAEVPELNVLLSVVRNSAPNYTNRTTNYPTYMKYFPYIKDNKIQVYAPKIINGQLVYSDTDWKVCHAEFGQNHKNVHNNKNSLYQTSGYTYNLKIRNYTKNLKIQNNSYDSYTHEYLGDFLRFQRDYQHINLMPLYNCFSNKTCPKLDLSIKISEDYTAKFNTADENYKIYVLPVKLFNTYTIAFDCDSEIEMCCGLFGQYQYDSKYSTISEATYNCFNNMQFNKPVLFNNILKLNNYLTATDPLDLAQLESDLKLFIKVPFNNKSSLVVLEGDYTTYNDTFVTEENDVWTRKSNHTAINFEGDFDELANMLITPLQLLKANTGESYPFADRLIEYLVGNTITHIDKISDNVERAKKIIINNTDKSLVKLVQDGIWDSSLQLLLYNYINSRYNTNEINHDILGYVDKDVEQKYSNTINMTTYKNGVKLTETKKETISSANIYDEWED